MTEKKYKHPRGAVIETDFFPMEWVRQAQKKIAEEEKKSKKSEDK